VTGTKVGTRSTRFTDVALAENAPQIASSVREFAVSLTENAEILANERSPKFTRVTDVEKSRKSPDFSHVATAPGPEKCAGGRFRAKRFPTGAVALLSQPVHSHLRRLGGDAILS